MPIIGVIASSGDRNVPDAPTIGTATNVGTGRAYNNGRADVTFTAPVYTGGTPITGYTVTSSPGGFTGTGASSPISVTGLQSGVAYTFTVTATNAVGTSAPSAASNSITATTVPQAPTIGTATDLGTGTSVSVAFTAGATGGSAITGFTATSSPGSITGTGGSSPITVLGLTSGTAYTFTVTATNANGTSAASAASNSVTPQVPGSFNSIASSTYSGVNSVTFSGIPSSYTHLMLRGSLRASAEASMYMRMNGVTTSVYHGMIMNYYRNGSTDIASFGASSYIQSVAKITSNQMTGMVSYIPSYTNTNFRKIEIGYAGGVDTGENSGINMHNSVFDSTSAVTSVTIYNQQNNMNAASTIALYGIA